MNNSRSRIPQGVLLGPILGVVFLVFSYLRLAGDSQSLLFQHAAYQAVFEGPILGTRLATIAGWFATALVLIHLALGLVCWLLARLTLIAFPATEQSPRSLTALWFVMVSVWLLLWNAGHYPHSSLGAPYADFVAILVLKVPLHAWFTGLFLLATGTILMMACLRRLHQLPFGAIRRRTAWAAIPLVTVACAAAWPEGRVAAAPADKPNVILLGIDSLRYDETQFPGASTHTPRLDAFLSDAVRLENAITPLARTFPSWMSLLTGRHPHSTGAILNLLPAEAMKRGPTLPELLRAEGYHTAYAIDEVRFSNIDETYGFDEVATPRIGSADFILGAASDTPLLNSIVNTRLGKWLFPYSHANRAVAHNYDPETFVARVSQDIEYRSPMFLAAHLTLPHWPYSWRDSPTYPKSQTELRPRFYIDAVRRADEQFGDILASLEKRGVLDNAIVIAFSDHGETFGSQQDMLTPPSTAQSAPIGAQPAFGHGTTVLAPHQYRVFLALRAYGPARQYLGNAPGVVSFPASLEDLAPTVLDMLDLPEPPHVDGVSLLPELQSGARVSSRLAQRVRFTETEFNPWALAITGDANTAVSASSLAEAALYYRVDPETDRLEMKTQFLDTLRRNREFAALGWTQMLGVFPRPQLNSYLIYAIDLRGGDLRRVESTADMQHDPEIAELWERLCVRYGDIIDSGTQGVRCALPRAT